MNGIVPHLAEVPPKELAPMVEDAHERIIDDFAASTARYEKAELRVLPRPVFGARRNVLQEKVSPYEQIARWHILNEPLGLRKISVRIGTRYKRRGIDRPTRLLRGRITRWCNAGTADRYNLRVPEMGNCSFDPLGVGESVIVD